MVLGGKLLADVVRLLAQAAVIGLLGLVVGAKLHLAVAGLVAALIALGLFAIAFCSLSCLVAMKTGAPESMATFVHLVNMPLLFTSSALVPARQMPDWLAAISRVNPLTLAVEILFRANRCLFVQLDHHTQVHNGLRHFRRRCISRGLLLGDFGSLGRALMLLAAIGIVLLAVAWTTAKKLRREN